MNTTIHQEFGRAVDGGRLTSKPLPKIEMPLNFTCKIPVSLTTYKFKSLFEIVNAQYYIHFDIFNRAELLQ